MDDTSSACEGLYSRRRNVQDFDNRLRWQGSAQMNLINLRYFERRLTEVIQSMQPAATRWRLVLLVAFGCTLWSAYFWLMDPSIRSVTLVDSLQKHFIFSACVPSLLFLFGVVGIHNRVVAPSIALSINKITLAQFAEIATVFILILQYAAVLSISSASLRMADQASLYSAASAVDHIASRCRSVLADFSLSCDDSGKLIVRPPHRLNSTP